MDESCIIRTSEITHHSEMKDMQEQSMEDIQEQSIDTHVNRSLELRSGEPELQQAKIVAQYCEHTQSDVQVLCG